MSSRCGKWARGGERAAPAGDWRVAGVPKHGACIVLAKEFRLAGDDHRGGRAALGVLLWLLLPVRRPEREKVALGLCRRIEPKTYFANERTFLNWMHMSIVTGTIASALLGLANNSGERQSALPACLLANPQPSASRSASLAVQCLLANP